MRASVNAGFGVSSFVAYLCIGAWHIRCLVQLTTAALYLKWHPHLPKCTLLYICALVTWVPLMLAMGCASLCAVPMACMYGVMYVELAQDICTRMSKSDDDMDSIPL